MSEHTSAKNNDDIMSERMHGSVASRTGTINQGPLHAGSIHLDPIDAANFPIDVNINDKNIDVAEYVEKNDRGYITRPDGVKLVVFSDNDPENPKNWSKLYKWYVTCVVAMVCFCVAFGSAVVTGYMSGPKEYFHISTEVTILTCTLFVVGFGIGPMVFAPMSELFGRQVVYISTLFIAVIFIVPCGAAKSIGVLLAFRLLDGIAFSAPMTLVGGTLADMWREEERGIAMALFSAAPFMGPIFGPIVGGFVGENVGWRWIYWVFLIFAGVVFAVLTVTVPETYAPVILSRRAKKLRKETGDPSFKTDRELSPLQLNEMVRISLLRPFVLLLTEPIVFLITIYMSILYMLVYAFFFAFPVVFQEGKGYSDGITGLMFLGVLIGVIFATCLAPFINSHYQKIHNKYNGRPPPEMRLIPMMIFCWTIPIGLFIFGWTAYPRLTWVGPVFGTFPCGVGFSILYNSGNNYVVDSYQQYAASALAAKTFLRSFAGAGVTLFTLQMFHGLGVQWASSLLAFISLACCAIPFGFFFYGAKIRSYSKYAYSPEDEAAEIAAHPPAVNAPEKV